MAAAELRLEARTAGDRVLRRAAQEVGAVSCRDAVRTATVLRAFAAAHDQQVVCRRSRSVL